MSKDVKDDIAKKGTEASTDLFERDNLSKQTLKDEDQYDLSSVDSNEELFLQNIQEGTQDEAKEFLLTDKPISPEVNNDESIINPQDDLDSKTDSIQSSVRNELKQNSSLSEQEIAQADFTVNELNAGPASSRSNTIENNQESISSSYIPYESDDIPVVTNVVDDINIIKPHQDEIVTTENINHGPTLTIDPTGTMDEDGGSVSVSFSASDVDGTIVSTIASVDPRQGSVVVNEDHSITFTPVENFHGEVSITVVITDDDGATATQSSTITVSDINDAPTLRVDSTATMDEDGGNVTINFSASDIDGTIASTTASVDPEQGSVQVNADHTITFTPAENFHGEAAITVVTIDDDGATATQNSTISVSDINDAPTLRVDSTATMDEDGGNVTINFSASDIDGTIASKMATVDPEQGTAVVNADNSITFTPAENFHGEAAITVVTTDDDGSTATQSSTITVSDINDAPTLRVDSTATMDEDGGNVTINFSASDIDGTIASTMATVDPEQGTAVVNADNSITFTPAENFHGEAAITVVTTDDDGATATKSSTITVSDINDAPTLRVDSTATMDEDGGHVSIQFNAADVDGSIASVTASVPEEQGSVMVNADHTITFTPAENFHGEAAITVVTTDDDGATATQSSIITVSDVNDAPTLRVDSTATMDEDGGNVTINFSASDIDGTIASTTASVDPEQGSVQVNADHSITFTPAENFHGEAAITLVTTDDDGATATQSSIISVSDINDAPTLRVDSTATMDEDGGHVSIQFNAADVDGSIASVTASVPEEQGSVMVNADHTITFTPAENFHGEAAITVVTTDDDGATATQSSIITVSDVNDASILRVDSTATMDEDGGNVTINFSASDIDGTIASTTASVDPEQGSVQVNADHSITFTPAENFHGEAAITVVTTDDDGATATQSSTITVSDINDAPTLRVDSTATMDEDGGNVTINFSASDIDGTIESVSASVSEEQGSVQVNADHSITFTPAENFHGEAAITVVTTDDDGATATQSSTISVSDINDAPTLRVDSTATMDEDGGNVTINFSASDIDGTIASTTASVDPEQGSVQANADHSITFTPAENFHGEAAITVVITDDDGATATQSSIITVSDLNDAPTLTVDSTATMDEDGGNVTINFSASDIDGTIASTTASVDPEQGSVQVNADHSITFTPAENFHGEAAITVVTTDDDGATATQSSTISVSDINDAPTLRVDSTATMDEDGGNVTINFSASDIDGTIASTTASVDPEQGSVQVNADHSITFTPAENFHGEAAITVVTTDDDGATVTQSSTISVSDINDAPIAANDSIMTNEDTAYTLSGDDFGYSDAEGDVLSAVQITDLPVSGSLMLNGNTVKAGDEISAADITNCGLVYTPETNSDVNVSFAFKVNDGTSWSNTATTTIEVEAVADAAVLNVSLADVSSSVSTSSSISTNETVKNYNADVGKKGAETIEIKELADNQTVESMTLEIEKYQSGKDGVITITAYDKDGNQVGDSMSMDAAADDDHKYNYEFNPENGGEFNYISVSVGDDTHIKVKKILADVKTTEEPDSYSYDIDVTVALADTDSSESITEVTISGHDIPDGVKVYQDDTEITANDDGDYLLNANDLSDVNIISPTELLSDGEGGFKLEVTATTTDSGGDSETMTAVLIDGVVEGVEYSTSSGLHGFTDENGGYSFHEGDTITFNVGGVELGSVTAEEAMAGQTFLQDIADVDRSDMNDEHLENMATFLQSIDSDSSDNILITAETRDALANVTLDLNTASEAAVQELVESIGGVYVDEAAAMNHVQDMLEEYTDMESVDFDEHIDDQNENQSTHQLMSATLVVNAIEDISYETSSGLAGDTSKTGTFEYNAGDSITFYDSDGAMISVINAHDIGDDGLITFEEISALSDDFDHNSEYFEDITDTGQAIESEQTSVTDTDDLSEIDVLGFDTSGTTEQELTDAFTQLDVAGSFDVDTSNGWIDATETTLSEDTFSADNVDADSDNPWTLIVNGEETDDQLAVSVLNLVADTTGIVNSSEESEVLMDESERIEW